MFKIQKNLCAFFCQTTSGKACAHDKRTKREKERPTLQDFRWRCHAYLLLYTATQILKSDSIGRKSKQILLVLKKFCYFCNGSRFCVLNWVYSMLIGRQPTPSWSWEVQITFSVISGQWVGRGSRHNIRRLSDAVFETSRILQTFWIIVSNMVNGRCPGCDLSIPVETL